jgi:hypothetical protein
VEKRRREEKRREERRRGNCGWVPHVIGSNE